MINPGNAISAQALGDCTAENLRLGFELRTQDSGLRTQDSGLRTQDSGLRTKDSGLRTQDSGLSRSVVNTYSQ